MVIIIDLNKPFYIINPKNCDYITLVNGISSADETISSMLMISKANILHKWCQHNNLDGDNLIDTTETGYANDNIALEWL